MLATDFIDALGGTAFGGIICVNLYRSIQVGTIPPASVKTFVAECLSAWRAAPPPTTPVEEQDLALRCAKDWGARAASSRANRFAIPASSVHANQLATIVHYKTLVANARHAAHRTYAPRRSCTFDDLNALVKEWKDDGAVWQFGSGRDFFWVAPTTDWASIDWTKYRHGTAQYFRDFLGLSHWGRNDSLVRISLPSSIAPVALTFFRPTAYDGCDNPAFFASPDNETLASRFPHGRTADLAEVRAAATRIDGSIEWICSPMHIGAERLIWEYLGNPKLAECLSETSFHDEMLVALTRATPLWMVLPFLKKLLT